MSFEDLKPYYEGIFGVKIGERHVVDVDDKEGHGISFLRWSTDAMLAGDAAGVNPEHLFYFSIAGKELQKSFLASNRSSASVQKW